MLELSVERQVLNIKKRSNGGLGGTNMYCQFLEG